MHKVFYTEIVGGTKHTTYEGTFCKYSVYICRLLLNVFNTDVYHLQLIIILNVNFKKLLYSADLQRNI